MVKKKPVIIGTLCLLMALAYLAWTLRTGSVSGATQVLTEAKVYTQPNAHSRILCTLHQGEKVLVLDTAQLDGKLWHFVETPKCLFGQYWHGWVQGSNLKQQSTPNQ